MSDVPIACTLTPDAMTARRARELVAAESQCCAFLEFTITREL